MKATLHFDLDEPGDRKAHTRAVKSTNAYLAIRAIVNKFYKPESFAYLNLEQIREILAEYGIDVDEELD
jgi:hypothetical protein